MPHIVEDRVLESTTTTGTGDITLAAAVTGFRRFNAVCAVGDTAPYFIEAVDSVGLPTGDYEYGIGTYSAANTLTRTTVLGSSNAGALVNFAAGAKNVGIALLSWGVRGGSTASAAWRRHPDGTIEQWGHTGATSETGDTLVAFPIAFPVACESVQVTYVNTAGSAPILCTVGAVSVAGFGVSAWDGPSRVAGAGYWSAKGR